nr:integrase, catalytic region, zinc finger, CCHC-type, peptidase aspartic, catalytic [Tanacetum cinerariifolium]
MIVAGADNRPPMLEKSKYTSWSSSMRLYIKGKENDRIMLNSIDNGPLVYGTIEEDGVTWPKKYEELMDAEKLQDNCELVQVELIHGELLQGKLVSFCSRRISPRRINPRKHERMILESVEHGPLIWSTIEENGVTRTKKYEELSATKKIQADCDLKATNIILQRLLSNVYSLVNHHRVAKDLWERVQLLMVTVQSVHGRQSLFAAGISGTIANISGTGGNNSAYQEDDLDAYDSASDDFSTTKAVGMANLSSYGLDVLFEIMETIRVDFDELTAMASEQSSTGLVLHEMTIETICSRLVQNPPPSTPFFPPTKNDWDLLFQPMFNEYFNPPPSDVSPVCVTADLTGSPS